MKKLGISLLVLALVLSFVSANASIGARANITTGGLGAGTSVSNFVVLGLNNIDILFNYASKDKDALGTAESQTDLAIGGTYYFAKLGDVKVGAHGLYVTKTNLGGTKDVNPSSIKLGLDLNAPIANGLSVGVTGYIYETNGGKASSTVDNKGSAMGVWSSYAVYAQVTAF